MMRTIALLLFVVDPFAFRETWVSDLLLERAGREEVSWSSVTDSTLGLAG